jgi:hypothetical protein
MSSRDGRVAYDYIHALAWVGIIVAAVIDFFTAAGKLGREIDFAADLSWAMMNLLIALYALLHHRVRWRGPVIAGSAASVAAVLALGLEYGLALGLWAGLRATGLNLGVTLLHLFLQFKFYSRASPEKPAAEKPPELELVQREKERALAGDANLQCDVALSLLGRATAAYTSTHGSKSYFATVIELLEHAWKEGRHIQAKYQLTQIYQGRYLADFRDAKEALRHYRELLKYFNGKDYQALPEEEKRRCEKIERAVRQRLEK